MERIPNVVLQQLRLTMRQSQAEVADLMSDLLSKKQGREYSIDASYVSKLERGAISWPSRAYREVLAEIFHTDQLGFCAVRTRRDAERVDPTHRREFLTFLTLPAAAPLADAADPGGAARIGRSDALEFEARIDALAILQRSAGGGTAHVLCTPEMQHAVTAARHASMTPAVREQWCRGISRLSGTSGWAIFDANRESAALDMLETGLAAAEEARDPGLTAFLAEISARLHVQMRRPAQALAELRRAYGPVPPGIAATSAALAARALALTGDARGVAREVNAADAWFARLGQDTSSLQKYADSGKHYADTADALFDLASRTNRPEPELIRRFHEALALLPADRGRTRAVAGAKLAHTYYLLGERELGDAAAQQARDAAASVTSSRLSLVLQEMGQARLVSASRPWK